MSALSTIVAGRLVELVIAGGVVGCGSPARHPATAAAGSDGGSSLAATVDAGVAATNVGDGRAAGAAAVDAGTVAVAVKAIGVGEHLSCALLESGEVRCWGSIMLAAVPQSSVPVAVGIDGGVSLAVGPRHVCVAKGDGSVWCWGENRDGQLGDGTEAARGVPFQVEGLSGIVEVVAGGHHTCARDGAGAVWCWGHPGTVGHPRAKAASRPGRVVGLERATHLVAGDDVTCAFVDGGPPRCWGFNTATVLGNALGPVTRAVPSPPLAKAVALALGFRTACLTQADGFVYCAGDDQFGQLGDQAVPDAAQCDSRDGRTATCTWTDPVPPAPDYGRGLPPRPYRDLPPPPPPERHQKVFAARSGFVAAHLDRALALGAGHGRTCAITQQHDVSCWGQWYFGRDWAYHRPHVIAGTRGAVAIAVGEEHACALLADQSMRCWGYNRSGELGNGVATDVMQLSPDATAVAFP